LNVPEFISVFGVTRMICTSGALRDSFQPRVRARGRRARAVGDQHRRIDGFGKFANVAVLKGEQVKIMDEQGASLPDCPDLLKSLSAFTAPATWDDSVNVLVQLAASMRAHGHGARC